MPAFEGLVVNRFVLADVGLVDTPIWKSPLSMHIYLLLNRRLKKAKLVWLCSKFSWTSCYCLHFAAASFHTYHFHENSFRYTPLARNLCGWMGNFFLPLHTVIGKQFNCNLTKISRQWQRRGAISSVTHRCWIINVWLSCARSRQENVKD